MENLTRLLSTRPDYLLALRSGPPMPTPSPMADLVIEESSLIIPTECNSNNGLRALKNLAIAACIGFLIFGVYRYNELKREKKVSNID